MTPVSSRSQCVTRAFSATALSASLHFRLAVSMSVIQSWRSRAELARSIILSPPRGYATETWKDSSSATLHELDNKGGVVNRDTYLYALVPLLRESPTTESAKPDRARLRYSHIPRCGCTHHAVQSPSMLVGQEENIIA
jgi:hypothetical protein